MDQILRCLARKKNLFVYIAFFNLYQIQKNNRLAFYPVKLKRGSEVGQDGPGRNRARTRRRWRVGRLGLRGRRGGCGGRRDRACEIVRFRKLDWEGKGWKGLRENGMGRAGGIVERVILKNRGDVWERTERGAQSELQKEDGEWEANFGSERLRREKDVANDMKVLEYIRGWTFG